MNPHHESVIYPLSDSVILSGVSRSASPRETESKAPDALYITTAARTFQPRTSEPGAASTCLPIIAALLLSSTRNIVADIEGSTVPVIVYVAPTGSRAGSAGFFILEAADVAAMAPGTNAGAAHPVIEGATLDPIMKQKLENDTAAFMRSFVARRGRNVSAAEDGIRDSKSYSDSEALGLKLIDLVAPDDATLLRQLDGRTIKRFDGSSTTLHLQNPAIVADAPSTRERLLTRLANPDIAVILLIVGGLLIYLEFNVPGTIVPGALGTLCVLLAAFGLNLLPVRHTAVALLIAAVALIVLEAKFSSHGVLATVGVACLVFGLATLVDAPIAEMRVHLSTALAAGIGFGGISFFLAWIALLARRNKVLTGPAAMLRQIATVVTPLAPSGQVELRGELWQARLTDPSATLATGSYAKVDAIDGLVLLVQAAGEPE